MTSTDATGSLLERYQKKSLEKGFYNGYEFKRELQLLLETLCSSSEDMTADQTKLLAEYQTYFTWDEDYSFDFDAHFYVEDSPTISVTIEDRHRFIALQNEDDHNLVDIFDEQIEQVAEDLKHDCYIDYEDISFQSSSVHVYDLELKPEFKNPPTKLESFSLFFSRLNSKDKKILSSVPLHVFKEVIEQFKTEENIS